MSDKPILFSAPMVRALLSGTKTQTRRTIKPRSHASLFSGEWSDDYVLDPGNADWRADELRFAAGDRLWVKETWRTGGQFDHLAPRDLVRGHAKPIAYCADEPPGQILRTGKARPSIFMLRWASRITLSVTEVRVQRLQQISDEDAFAEGIDLSAAIAGIEVDVDGQWWVNAARGRYFQLWDSINGEGAALKNPWVVAITFAVEQANIDTGRAAA